MHRLTFLALLFVFSISAEARVCFVSLLRHEQHQIFLQHMKEIYNVSINDVAEIDTKYSVTDIKDCLVGDYTGVFILAHSRLTALGDAAFVSYYQNVPFMISDDFFTGDTTDFQKKAVYVAACAPELFIRYPNLMRWNPVFSAVDTPASATHPSRVSSLSAARHLFQLLQLTSL